MMKITYGGWYQRTTLHLSEIYDLFERGESKLELSKEKLEELQKNLDLKKVSREAEYLEYVKARTNSGIDIRYYEDGLYVLETEGTDFKKGQKILEDYYEERFSPAINYIFSLGAPTPKILADIKSTHPIVIGLVSEKHEDYLVDREIFGEVYSKITSLESTVYKMPQYILIVSPPKGEPIIRNLVETQIFFREFKDQLEKYLDIHRTIWEEISNIKERKFIKGGEVGEVRSKLESYKKTVDLISSRINQMETYIHTRQSIAKQLKIEEKLITFFQYKFEVLDNTHAYIKEIWKMTSDYIDSAIQVVVETEGKSTTVGIKGLQIITSVGVVSGILGYLAGGTLPKITVSGIIYFVLLIFITWLINLVIWKIYRNQKYKLKFAGKINRI